MPICQHLLPPLGREVHFLAIAVNSIGLNGRNLFYTDFDGFAVYFSIDGYGNCQVRLPFRSVQPETFGPVGLQRYLCGAEAVVYYQFDHFGSFALPAYFYNVAFRDAVAVYLKNHALFVHTVLSSKMCAKGIGGEAVRGCGTVRRVPWGVREACGLVRLKKI